LSLIFEVDPTSDGIYTNNIARLGRTQSRGLLWLLVCYGVMKNMRKMILYKTFMQCRTAVGGWTEFSKDIITCFFNSQSEPRIKL